MLYKKSLLGRSLSLCLICALLFTGILPLTAVPARAYTILEYDIVHPMENGELYFNSISGTIVGGTVNGELNIPAQIQGRNVVAIGEQAFQSNSSITSIILPEGLKRLDTASFNYCSNVTNIVLPESLEYIGTQALANTLISELKLPENIQEIQSSAFLNTLLREITIPESITELNSGVFYQCKRLVSVKLPSQLTSLGDFVFAFCDSLSEIELPNTLRSIGESCFLYCSMLSQIQLPPSLEHIGSNAFKYCKLISQIELPEGLRSIGDFAFGMCTNIRSVDLPDSLERLGADVFPYAMKQDGDCYYIEQWLVRSEGPEAPQIREDTIGIANNALCVPDAPEYSALRISKVFIPANVKWLWAECFSDRNYIHTIEVDPANPYYSSYQGMLYNKDQTKLIFCGSRVKMSTPAFPQTLREIGDSAYCYNEYLQWLTLPNSVERIGNGAFYNNYCMKTVSFGNSLISIGDEAFYNCESLRTINLPNSLETIGDKAFASTKLTSAQFGSQLRSIGVEAFIGTNLQSVEFGDQLESIGDSAFQGLGLTYVHVGNSLRSIGRSAFALNAKLKSINLPATLQTVGTTAFYGCMGLERIIFHASAPVFGQYPFHYNTQYPSQLTVYNTPPALLPKLTVYYTTPEGWDQIDNLPLEYWPEAPIRDYQDVQSTHWYADAVNYVTQRGLMNGVGDGRFNPEGTMTRAMLVTVLWRLNQSPEPESMGEYIDVASSQWYAKAVGWASENGLVNGIGNGRFNPDGNISREQIATILYRYAAYTGLNTENTGDLIQFPDNSAVSSYALDALQWAVSQGLINGIQSNNTIYLCPQNNATRAQVATILMRFLEEIAE